jgi:decaprenyl-phosphate phosphoribosyltransferase
LASCMRFARSRSCRPPRLWDSWRWPTCAVNARDPRPTDLESARGLSIAFRYPAVAPGSHREDRDGNRAEQQRQAAGASIHHVPPHDPISGLSDCGQSCGGLVAHRIAYVAEGLDTVAPPAPGPQRVTKFDGTWRGTLPGGILRALRPKQWLKNVLVAAAPGAAGVLTEADVLLDVGLAFLAFCMVSSATYLLNDVRDVEADRLHPRKRYRAIAVGTVPVRLALALALALLGGGFALAATVRLELLIVVVSYVILTTAYTLWLKRVEVVDIVAIASGFILRAVAGGAAVDVPLSRWFIIVASFGSLFIVAGKRHGEHLDLEDGRGKVRAILAGYSRDYLKYVWTMASSVTIAAYCLWAFEMAPPESDVPLYELSIVPFVTFMLRYAQLLEGGHGEAPEDVVLGDRVLAALAAVWIALFGAGVYFL